MTCESQLCTVVLGDCVLAIINVKCHEDCTGEAIINEYC